MTDNIGGGRPIRPCDICGSYDDHPRHLVASAQDPNIEQLRHLDCCAQAGCPDGTCNKQLAGAEGKTGAALLAHLMEGNRS